MSRMKTSLFCISSGKFSRNLCLCFFFHHKNDICPGNKLSGDLDPCTWRRSGRFYKMIFIILKNSFGSPASPPISTTYKKDIHAWIRITLSFTSHETRGILRKTATINYQASLLPHPHFKNTGMARAQVGISCLPSSISR